MASPDAPSKPPDLEALFTSSPPQTTKTVRSHARLLNADPRDDDKNSAAKTDKTSVDQYVSSDDQDLLSMACNTSDCGLGSDCDDLPHGTPGFLQEKKYKTKFTPQKKPAKKGIAQRKPASKKKPTITYVSETESESESDYDISPKKQKISVNAQKRLSATKGAGSSKSTAKPSAPVSKFEEEAKPEAAATPTSSPLATSLAVNLPSSSLVGTEILVADTHSPRNDRLATSSSFNTFYPEFQRRISSTLMKELIKKEGGLLPPPEVVEAHLAWDAVVTTPKKTSPLMSESASMQAAIDTSPKQNSTPKRAKSINKTKAGAVRTPSPTRASPVQAMTPKEAPSPKTVRKSPRNAKTESQKWLAKEREIHGDVIHQKRIAAERLKGNKHK